MTSKKQKRLGAIDKATTANPLEGFTPLLGNLRQLIADSRQQVLRAVDTVQVQTYWHIGRHIVEFEQGGAQRAAYGQRLLPQLGQTLAAEFGRRVDATNLRHMRGFYQAFPIRDALRRELSWTHYRLMLRVDSAEARQWYMQEAAAQNWSTRALERQIGSYSATVKPLKRTKNSVTKTTTHDRRDRTHPLATDADLQRRRAHAAHPDIPQPGQRLDSGGG